MRIAAALAPAAFFLLACTGLFPEAGDSADTGDTGSGDGPKTYDQTDDCADYLDCLREVDNDEWVDAKERYGEDGSCWGTDEDKARGCDDACEDLYAALADDNLDIPECGGSDTGIGDTADTDDTSDTSHTGDTSDTSDTGDTSDTADTGTPTCPLDVGTWTFAPTWISDGCGAGAELTTLDMDVSCDRSGDMQLDTMLLGALPLSLPCVYDGRDFECAGSESTFGFSMELLGAANSAGTTASGDVVIAIGSDCASAGTFTAAL